MLQQLAEATEAQHWAIASMLLFIVVFAAVAYRVFRTPRAEHEAHARMPLDDRLEDGNGQPAREP